MKKESLVRPERLKSLFLRFAKYMVAKQHIYDLRPKRYTLLCDFLYVGIILFGDNRFFFLPLCRANQTYCITKKERRLLYVLIIW